MNKKSNKGVQGDWILFQPEQTESMLPGANELIQKGEVIEAGPESKCKPNDIVIVKDWQVERIRQNDTIAYYAPGSSILHII